MVQANRVGGCQVWHWSRRAFGRVAATGGFWIILESTKMQSTDSCNSLWFWTWSIVKVGGQFLFW